MGALYGVVHAPMGLDPDFPLHIGRPFVQRDEPITRLHQHDELELGLCHDGHGVFVVEGKTVPFRTGCVSVVSEREMHLAQSTRGSTSTWTFISVDPARLLAGCADPATLDSARLGGRAFANVLTPETHPGLCCLVAALVAEGRNARAPGHRDAARGLVLAIMAGLQRLPGREAGGAQRGASLHRLAPALGYLGSHDQGDIAIPVLASACRLSPTHFRRMFREAFGMSPLAYVVRYRLARATALLRDGRTSVLEAALRCGFGSLSSFQRHFRSAFGCSPRDWRRSERP